MHTSRLLRTVLAALVVTNLTIVLAACSAAPSSSESSPAADAAVEESGAAGTPAEEPEATQPVPDEQSLHTATLKPKGDEIAVIKTDRGVVKLKFFSKDAPNHVASFLELAEKKFYDGIKWHRVVPGFVVQGGDPLSKKLPDGDPNVGTGDAGYRLKAEFNARKHLEGTVAMARAQDVDSAGSQFYICLAPQPSLDGQYTVFGQVISGMDVVKKIQQGDSIRSIRIEHGPAGR